MRNVQDLRMPGQEEDSQEEVIGSGGSSRMKMSASRGHFLFWGVDFAPDRGEQ
jgi:hypothetical protein